MQKKLEIKDLVIWRRFQAPGSYPKRRYGSLGPIHRGNLRRPKPDADGEYFSDQSTTTRHPFSWATTANAARFGKMKLKTKGAYETLDDFSDAEIIDLAIRYAAIAEDAYWSVVGDQHGFQHRVTTHQIPALNFTHLTHILRDWEIIESVKQHKEQAALAA
jgi:hypothetical protein